ncbi:MAG: RNA methyltransferase [Melioribacteraceae bacterium]|nr:RNA methyltransferase [Melioribacteraceae bacterium]MCF8266296.1 RNA methyltransferase [Melioribacteraceae bacterium]
MISKNQLKYYSSLLLKKYRLAENKFLIEGKKLVREARTSGLSTEVIITTNEFYEDNPNFFDDRVFDGIRIEIISAKDVAKLSDTKTPSGVVAVVNKTTTGLHKNADMIIALEDISDPGNLGTIIRNCDWFGMSDLLISENSAEIYNPKVVRSSMGSLFHLRIQECSNFISDLEELKSNGYKIVSADLNSRDYREFSFSDKFVLVFCNESEGPSAELLGITDQKISIAKFGNAESLNVANANAIILAEVAYKNQIART